MKPYRLNTRKMVKQFYRSGWRRPFWLVAFGIGAVVAGRVALNPLLEREVRSYLADRQHAALASFRGTQIFLFPPSVTFGSVEVRGSDGEVLTIRRLEVHLAGLRELWAQTPRVRLRMMDPALRLAPDARGLQQWWRELPRARIDAVTIDNGSLSVAPGPDTRAFLTAIGGDVQGFFTGESTPSDMATPWELWADARVDNRDPAHVSMRVESDGTWLATLSVREVAADDAATGGALTIDGKLNGRGSQARGTATIGWSGSGMANGQTVSEIIAPIARERLRRLDGLHTKGPTLALRLAGMRAAAVNAAQTVDVAVEGVLSENDDPASAKSRLMPLHTVAVIQSLLRIANQVVAPPLDGVASLRDGESFDGDHAETPP